MKGDLRIIGAISIDLNGLSEEDRSKQFEQTQEKVYKSIFFSNNTFHIDLRFDVSIGVPSNSQGLLFEINRSWCSLFYRN